MLLHLEMKGVKCGLVFNVKNSVEKGQRTLVKLAERV